MLDQVVLHSGDVAQIEVTQDGAAITVEENSADVAGGVGAAVATTKKTRKPAIKKQEFIRVYTEIHAKGGNDADVAAALGRDVATIQTKASSFRREGIPLVKGGGRGTGRKAEQNTEEMLQLIADLEGVSLEVIKARQAENAAEQAGRKAAKDAELAAAGSQ
jgi:hypothetical protein